VSNKLVFYLGPIYYIEVVLVPKLVVKLIIEDIDIEEEKVRKVLKESRWIGDLLYKEVEDIVDENVDSYILC